MQNVKVEIKMYKNVISVDIRINSENWTKLAVLSI